MSFIYWLYFTYIFYDSIQHNGGVSPESYNKAFDSVRTEDSVCVYTQADPPPVLRKEFESRHTKHPYNSLAITRVFCTFNRYNSTEILKV
jgi:hypothetical protein